MELAGGIFASQEIPPEADVIADDDGQTVLYSDTGEPYYEQGSATGRELAIPPAQPLATAWNEAPSQPEPVMDSAPVVRAPMRPRHGTQQALTRPLAPMYGVGDNGSFKHEQAHLLGISSIAVALGSFLGLRYGGLYGALSGSLFAGAGLNGYRAIAYYRTGSEESRKEAMVSSAYALAGAGIASYFAYMASKRTKSAKRKEEAEVEDDE